MREQLISTLLGMLEIRAQVRRWPLQEIEKQSQPELIMSTGYARDSSAVAREAVKHAAQEGYDCVLIDTAGRMQVRDIPLTR